jgi:translation elongation factor EF-Ts
MKDDTKTIKNLIEDVVGKIGENIEVKHFARFEIK